MNEKSKEILKEAGWYEGRNIDIDDIVRYCEEGGYGVFPKAKEFFKEFGNIIIKKDGYNYHVFDLKKVFARGQYNGCLSEVISEVIGEKVLLIGNIYGSMFDLYISESGKIYDDHACLGENIYEAWDCILETLSYEECTKRSVIWERMGLKDAFWEAYNEVYYGNKLRERIIKLQNEGLSNKDIAKAINMREEFVVKLASKK